CAGNLSDLALGEEQVNQRLALRTALAFREGSLLQRTAFAEAEIAGRLYAIDYLPGRHQATPLSRVFFAKVGKQLRINCAGLVGFFGQMPIRSVSGRHF